MGINYRLLLISVVVVASCARRPVNLSTAKNEVVDYYESGAFEREVRGVINRAIKHFERMSLDGITQPVVVIDVDETVLDNYAYVKKIDFGYSQGRAHKIAQKGVTPAIPEVKRLYDYLISRGVHIIFITGRRQSKYEGTYQNLQRQGYTVFDELLMKPEDMHKILHYTYKLQQREYVTQQGYTIIGSVGDQWSDVCGPYTGYRVKIPNYLYTLQ